MHELRRGQNPPRVYNGRLERMFCIILVDGKQLDTKIIRAMKPTTHRYRSLEEEWKNPWNLKPGGTYLSLPTQRRSVQISPWEYTFPLPHS
jgi:hypothetical protein